MYSARVIGCDFTTLLTLAAERLLITTTQKKQAQTPASDAVDVQARRIQQKLPDIDVRQKNRNYIL